MTQDQINSLRAKLAASTQGEWEALRDELFDDARDSLLLATNFGDAVFYYDEDAAFIAAAHNFMGELLDAADQLDTIRQFCELQLEPPLPEGSGYDRVRHFCSLILKMMKPDTKGGEQE